MTFRYILALASGEDGDTAVLEAGLRTARLFNSHVEVLHAGAQGRDLVPIGSDPFGLVVPQLLAALEEESRRKARAARELFDRWQAENRLATAAEPRDGVSVGWRQTATQPQQSVARAGRLADLILIGTRREGDETDSTLILESALFGSGRPVLHVRSGSRADSGQRRAAVLWDGGLQAARAARDAIPLLQRAAETVVLSLQEDKPAGEPDAEGCAQYLRWHGVEARIEPVRRSNLPLGEVLLGEATDFGADLIVMGAYGHSRAREFVLGGVTRYMLAHARLPLFLAH